MNIIVIDSQGGGIGKQLILRLKQENPDLFIIALGTNALATNNMLKAGADGSATGENAILYNCRKAASFDIIVGPIGIIIANSMLGEISPAMARAVTESEALKILIPYHKCSIQVMGTVSKPLAQYIEEAVSEIKEAALKHD